MSPARILSRNNFTLASSELHKIRDKNFLSSLIQAFTGSGLLACVGFGLPPSIVDVKEIISAWLERHRDYGPWTRASGRVPNSADSSRSLLTTFPWDYLR